MIIIRFNFEEEDDRLEFLKLGIGILMNSAICFTMFRRAMSTIKLGKRDWAKLDLMMAAETDPNNKEYTHEESPIGLGMSLVPPKKKANQGLEKNNVRMKSNSHL
ncbi:RNA polymerase II-associated protein 3 [Bienertia sinuspersici]